jgi:hypothetical protein
LDFYIFILKGSKEVTRLIGFDRKDRNRLVFSIGIPLWQTRYKPGKTIYRLFGLIPLWQVRKKSNRTIYRLFSFIPVLKIKQKNYGRIYRWLGLVSLSDLFSVTSSRTNKVLHICLLKIRFHSNILEIKQLLLSLRDKELRNINNKVSSIYQTREQIRQRTKEALARAKINGQKLGREFGSRNIVHKISAEQIKIIRKRLSYGETKRALAAEYGVSLPTLYNALKRSASQKVSK